MTDPSRPTPLQSSAFDAVAAEGIRHGFFTRAGGVSEGIYRGLNIGNGSADVPEHVAENRRRVCDWLGVGCDRLLSAHQVHSPDVIKATGPFEAGRPKADAIVTDRPGLAVSATTADCGPILFADGPACVVGAAHAGWKGAFTGVIENTIQAMEELGADRARIVAVLGPSIGPGSYEVGPEFVSRFVEDDGRNEHFFQPSETAGHAWFDLPSYIVGRLSRAGVIGSAMHRDTYADEELFFSYRRTTHRGEPDYGRQISAIVIQEYL